MQITVFIKASRKRKALTHIRYLLFDSSVHEILISEWVGEEAFNLVREHVDICIEVERNDTSCAHQEVFSSVHKFRSDSSICALLADGDDENEELLENE